MNIDDFEQLLGEQEVQQLIQDKKNLQEQLLKKDQEIKAINQEKANYLIVMQQLQLKTAKLLQEKVQFHDQMQLQVSKIQEESKLYGMGPQQFQDQGNSQQIKKLENELSDKIKTIEKLNKELMQSKENIQQLKEECAQQKKDYAILKSNFDQLQKEKDTLAKEKTIYIQKQQDTENNLLNIIYDKENLEKQLNNCQSEIQSYQQICQDQNFENFIQSSDEKQNTLAQGQGQQKQQKLQELWKNEANKICLQLKQFIHKYNLDVEYYVNIIK